MYSLTDAYENGSGSTAMTIVMGVIASLLFTTGLFLIFSSHNSSQSKNLQQTLAALQKNLAQSGDSSSAALLSLEAALSAQEGGKVPSTTLPNSFSLDSLTVKGTANLQGTVKTGKDLNVGGGLNADGDTSLNGDLDVAGNVQTAGDVTLDGDLSASSLALSDGLTVGSDVQVTGDMTLDGALEITDAAQLDNGLVVTGDTTTDTLETTGDVAVGGGIEVTGATQLDNGLAVTGNATIGGSLEVTDTTQLDNGLAVTGDTTTDTLETTGNATVGGNIDVTGTAQLEGGATVTGSTTTDTLVSTGDVTAGGDLQVNGDNSVNGNTALGVVDSQNQLLGGGNLEVYGDTTLGSGLTYTLGSDLITTHDFTNIAWTSTSWTTTTSNATHNTGNISALSTSQVTPTASQTYQVNYTISGSPAAGSTLVTTFGGQTVHSSTFPGGTDGNTSISLTVTASSAAGLSFTPSSTFDGTVSAVSIKQVTSTQAGGLEVAGSTQLDSGLTVTGGTTTDALDTTNNAEIGGTLTIDNSGSVADGLTVTGNGSFDSISTSGNGDIGGALTIDNGGSATNALDVTGNGNFDSISTSGGAVIGGDATVSGNATVTGQLTAGGQINAYSSTGLTEKMGVQIDSCNGHVDVTQIYNGIIVGVNGSVSNGGVTGCSTGTDLAEFYPSTQSLNPGDVVSIDTNNSQYVVRSSGTNDNLAIGIVSTNPGETLGDSTTGYPIALTGRVPVNVTNEGGAIAPGDYLTTSSTPGYAMKAAAGDKIIGQALESFSGTAGQVVAFIDITPNNGTVVQTTQSPTSGDASFTSLNVSGTSTLSDLTVTGSATIANLAVTGTASVANLIVDGHVIGNGDTRGVVTISAGQTTVRHDFGTAYTQTPVIVASPEGQPVNFDTTPSATGFDISLASPATSDIKFDYLVEQ